MKIVTNYICEKCGQQFDDLQEALNCEKSHVNIISVEPIPYAYMLAGDSMRYPCRVRIHFEDGKVFEYGLLYN